MWSSLFTPLSILLITTFVSGLSKDDVDIRNDESWTVTVTRTSYTTIAPVLSVSFLFQQGSLHSQHPVVSNTRQAHLHQQPIPATHQDQAPWPLESQE